MVHAVFAVFARLLLLLIVVLVATTREARADVPWAEGVPPAVQAKANAVFAEANQLFAQQAHARALEEYRRAIAIWDHPLIRFNMSVTLIRLDRILEAADEIERALRYGQTPFSAELYQQAQDYQRLIGGRVGTIEASCQQERGQILLDGKPWFSCPGTKSQRVLAGEHIILGESTGFVTKSQRVLVSGGKTTREALQFIPIEAAVKLEYPVARWVPWAVASVGAVIGFGGLGLYFVGKDELDQFATAFDRECPRGCASDLSDVPDLKSDYDNAVLKGRIAVGAMIAGGGITLGAILWGGFGNRPRRVLPAMEVTPTNGGMTARVGWRF